MQMEQDLSNQFEQFQFLDLIGKGSFGIVYKAFNKKTNQTVAVKVQFFVAILDDYLTLQQEAMILQELSHPNIVKFFGVYENESKILIEMELIEGGALNANEKYSEEQAKFIMFSILNALSYMHDNNIVHRDLKPENILVSKDLTIVKVSDFGLSTAYSSLMTKQCGTITYMAPEQLSNKLYNKSIDIWASGVIMYQLLENKHPYYQKGIDILSCIKIMHDNCRENINNIQFSLFRRLTDIDPSRRYSATQALQHPWFKNGGDEPLTFEEQFQQWIKSQNFLNMIISMMILSKMGFKKQIEYKELCNKISQQNSKYQNNNNIDYDQLFAEYQQSLTDAQKTKMSTRAITPKLEQQTTLDTKISNQSIIKQSQWIQPLGITLAAKGVKTMNAKCFNKQTTPVDEEKIEQEIQQVKSSHQVYRIPEKLFTIRPIIQLPLSNSQTNNQQDQIFEDQNNNDNINFEQIQQQSIGTNTTTTSPNKSPIRKRRAKKINKNIINEEIVQKNISDMVCMLQSTKEQQVTSIKLINPTQVLSINSVRETNSPKTRYKIHLKPLNHPNIIMTTSQRIQNVPLKPRIQHSVEKETYAPPVLDLTNLALECMSPKYRKNRTNSLNQQRRVYANEFQPSRVLASMTKRQQESFYYQDK